MKKGLLLFSVLALVVAFTMLSPTESTAFGTFANGCDSCHNWGYSTGEHQTHFSNGCSSCHVQNGDNPSTSTCASCHNGVTIMNNHNDMGIGSCIGCHGDVPNDDCSFGQMKILFN